MTHDDVRQTFTFDARQQTAPRGFDFGEFGHGGILGQGGMWVWLFAAILNIAYEPSIAFICSTVE
jgi:hypothetical protein